MKRSAICILVLLVLPLTACDRGLVENSYKTLASAEEIYLAAGGFAGELFNSPGLTDEQKKEVRTAIEPVLDEAYLAIHYGYDALKEYVSLTSPGPAERAALLGSVGTAAEKARALVTAVSEADSSWKPPLLHTFSGMRGAK